MRITDVKTNYGYQAEFGWYESNYGLAPDKTWYGLKSGERIVLKGENAKIAHREAKKRGVYKK